MKVSSGAAYLGLAFDGDRLIFAACGTDRGKVMDDVDERVAPTCRKRTVDMRSKNFLKEVVLWLQRCGVPRGESVAMAMEFGEWMMAQCPGRGDSAPPLSPSSPGATTPPPA